MSTPKSSPSSVIAEYLQGRPGFFRPRDVADATGVSPHQAATTLRYLWERGRIDRLSVHREGGTRPQGRYGTEDGKVREATLQPIWFNPKYGDKETVVPTPPPSKEMQ